ncbi:MAG: winged helix-turn-helix domain-containing protein [Nitrosopumilales archaeon]|nr:MAG: winged helix-turn-helix domain-containing protein [Nitrosopumilales archaeon]
MVSKGAIQEYITDINFAVLGYRIYYIFTKHEEKSSKDSSRRKMIIEHLNRLGNIIAEIEVLGGVSIFRVAIREANNGITQKDDEDNTISILNGGIIEKVIVASNTMYKKQQPYPTPTDLKVIRCLVLNPQIGVADISRLVFVSTKTANRILNKLTDDVIVRFSVICDPAAMKGLVVFGLLIYVNDGEGEKQRKNKKPGSHKILERLYSEFPEYPFLRSPLISHDNIIIVSVFGNDVFAIDSMFKKVLSFQEVKKAELYVFTRIKYHKDWIANEIDRRLESKSL